jgi:hypothetical protein
MLTARDSVSLAAGAAAWAAAVPLVRAVGPVVANGGARTRGGVLLLALAIGAGTTPLLARLLGWKSSAERVRGVALALGAAQTLDGVVHLFAPTFYSAKHSEALGAAGSIFSAAGLLGIFSAAL